MNKYNLYQMYMLNGCRLGFYVTRESWRSDRVAKVVKIDGVVDGEPIEGKAPYYDRYHPDGHGNAGKMWSRKVYMEAPWFENGTYETESGGTYSWTMVIEKV